MNTYSINEWVVKSGLSRVYIHRAVLNGDLPASQEPMNGGKQYKHMVTEEDFNKWREERQGRGFKREDGRNKFVLYVSPEELESIKEYLEATNNGAIIEKPKQYQKSES